MDKISWPLSHIPESACNPISAVPPSPAWQMTWVFSFCPRYFNATSIPEATAAAFSKSECIQGTPHADSGYFVEKTSRQPVLLAIIVFLPVTSTTSLAAIAWPQPAQAVCPEPNRCPFSCAIYICSSNNSGFKSIYSSLMGFGPKRLYTSFIESIVISLPPKPITNPLITGDFFFPWLWL